MSKNTMAFIHLMKKTTTTKCFLTSGFTIGVIDYSRSNAEGLIYANVDDQFEPGWIRVTGLRLIKPLDVIKGEREEVGFLLDQHFEICPIALAGVVMISSLELELSEVLRLGKYRIDSSFKLTFEEIENLQAA